MPAAVVVAALPAAVVVAALPAAVVVAAPLAAAVARRPSAACGSPPPKRPAKRPSAAASGPAASSPPIKSVVAAVGILVVAAAAAGAASVPPLFPGPAATAAITTIPAVAAAGARPALAVPLARRRAALSRTIVASVPAGAPRPPFRPLLPAGARGRLARLGRLGVLFADLADPHVELFQQRLVEARLVEVDARRYRGLCRHRPGDLAALPPRGGVHQRVLEQQAVLWRAGPRPEGPEQGLFGPEKLYSARRHHCKAPEAAGPRHYARPDGGAEYRRKVGRGPAHLPLEALLDAGAQGVQLAHLAGQPLHRLEVPVRDVAAAAAPRRGR